jgi:hypothetical protein
VRWNRRSRLRLTIALCVAALVGSGTYAYTAQNTVSPSFAGIGANVIDGYSVSTPTFVLDSADPSTIDSVSFTLSTANGVVPSTVSVQLSPGGAWYSCPGSLNVTCTTTGESAATATQLTVVAVK